MMNQRSALTSLRSSDRPARRRLTLWLEEIVPPILRVTDLPRGAITRDNACASLLAMPRRYHVRPSRSRN